jgi:uncharacterized protein YqhQ
MADNFRYGGQAVMEGVMMRGQQYLVTAVRNPAGEIVFGEDRLHPIFTGRLRKMPFLRGVFVLIEAMGLGIKSLMFSANVALGEEEQTTGSSWYLWGMVAVSLAFSVGLFFLLPLVITKAMPFPATSVLFHLIEGLVRVTIFVIYLKLISLLPDLKRVFAYHGAEHKAINAYEAGETLSVETVRPYPRQHTRCGTSFLFVVLVIAILVFSLGSVVIPGNLGYLVLSRIVLLPVIGGISYEIIQFSARHCGNPIMKVVMAPGLWLQGLTTREPDESQLEVGIASLEKLFEIEGAAAQCEPCTSPAESGV